MKTNRSAEAATWLAEDTHRTPIEAAQKFGISQAAISQYRKKLKRRGVCPCCGQLQPTTKD